MASARRGASGDGADGAGRVVDGPGRGRLCGVRGCKEPEAHRTTHGGHVFDADGRTCLPSCPACPGAGLYALELFPCSGGMAEGFRRAGITFAVAFDKDPDAIESYERNLGHRPIEMDVRDLLRLVRGGWRPTQGPIDLLVADPPCTPWSRAGKRLGTEDERDMLKDTAELIALLRPAAYLIGNVPGLQDATQWHIVQDVIGGLVRHGYCVADYVQLDAADYGVPQHRVRPFWYGHLEGPCIRWPEPTHGDPKALPTLPHVRALHPWVTCRQALGHLTGEDLGRQVRLKLRAPGEWSNGGDCSSMSKPDEVARTVMAHQGAKGGQQLVVAEMTHFPRHHTQTDADVPARTVNKNPNGDGTVVRGLQTRWDGTIREHGSEAPGKTVRASTRGQEVMIVGNERHPPAIADEPARTVGAKYRGQSEVLSVGREGGTPQSSRVWGPDEIAPTVQAREDRVGRGLTVDWPWDRQSTAVLADERLPPAGHHDPNWKDANGQRARSSANAVILSERAAAILQGFPEGWHFCGKTKKARWSQLGQAMPPGLAHPVAAAIAEQIRRTAAKAKATG